ncbi:MAG: heme ABC exporter ATP-binding protein CcmA [Actinomycetota bacterium]|jgi:heme ABC exporter ATP-binding subunit CcmA|nr:heme ABC exporter ATP-binding protein CcmA [Actinomycetota bacterium]
MSPVVEFQGAVALLGRFPALSGFDLTVEAGEIVLLQGPNGAGKTSFLRACSGLLAVTSGRARVLGHDLRTDRRGVRRHVGLLAHDNHLYADLWVRDQVRFRADCAGAAEAEIADAMERVGLPARLWRVPTERLSAGQRRRVAIASLIVRRPRLWLLDEPHAGLDAGGRDALDELLIAATGAGATVLFASHELDRAEAVATRRITVQGGRVVESLDAA